MTITGKLDLWQTPECPKMHPITKEKQKWENCAACSRTKSEGTNALSEWRACIL